MSAAGYKNSGFEKCRKDLLSYFRASVAPLLDTVELLVNEGFVYLPLIGSDVLLCLSPTY